MRQLATFLLVLLFALPGLAGEQLWGRSSGGSYFYGIDAGNGAKASVLRYEFEQDIVGGFQALDRTDPLVANWETDKGVTTDGVTAAGLSNRWRVSINGTPSGTLKQFANAIIDNDAAGNFGLSFWSDTVDNIVLSVAERNSFRWLNEAPGAREYAIEFVVGIKDLDNVDFFMGVCLSPTNILNPDGTIATSPPYVGFHFLRSDSNAYPVLAKAGGGVTTLPFPTLPEFDGGQPNPQPLGPSGFVRYAIKGLSHDQWEFYINDQLVGFSSAGSGPLFLEVPICMAYVTNGTPLDKAVFVDRIVAVTKDNN